MTFQTAFVLPPTEFSQINKHKAVFIKGAIFLALLFVWSGSWSQDKITIHVKNASFETTFKSILKQSGYFYWGDPKILRQSKPVSLNVKDVPMKEALDLCFQGQPLSYSIDDKIIVIKSVQSSTVRPTSPAIVSRSLSGTVTNEKGEPVEGVSIYIQGTSQGTVSNPSGNFALNGIEDTVIIIFSHVGYERQTIRYTGQASIHIILKSAIDRMGEATVTYSSGYDEVSAARSTGSYVKVSNELYNRRVAADVLSKIDGVSSGVYFNGGGTLNPNTYALPNTIGDPNNKLGINIRGQSTLANQVSKDPLIVLDNVPYEGDINNLSPEMIESVTVLKDAAAASIWGARAGNGVIVITTKKGKYFQKMKVDFDVSYTIGQKPNLFYSRNFLDANDYINVEDTLYGKGYLTSDLTNKTTFPTITPVAAILQAQAQGQLSAADAANQINAFRLLDVRRDYDKYIYQNSLNQQYGLTMRGGTRDMAYALSLGYDNNNTYLVKNRFDRYVVNGVNIYKPVESLEITTNLTFSQMNMQSNNAFNDGGSSNILPIAGHSYNALYPYAQFADAKGNHLPIAYKYSQYYIDSVQKLGFQDWSYRPLDELALSDNTNRQSDLLLRGNVKYHFTSFLNGEVQYENETQNSLRRIYYSPDTYYARNLVNTFTQYTPGSSILTYPLPLGGILSQAPSKLTSQTYRGQLNYKQTIAEKHDLTALAGAEVRQTQNTSYNTIAYGYDNDLGIAVSNLNYTTSFKVNPSGSQTLPVPNNSISITTNRFISYYSNLGYTYNGLYTITLSGRKDGANIFGVNTNDKITPLWSAGLGWNISKESFFKVSWLPYLRLRGSYGYNGNVYNATAYLTASYSTNSLTGLQQGSVTSPPNPSLRWERVKNTNLGFDFAALKNKILTGTIEFYQKEGLDLIEPDPLAPTTGFSSFNGNAASTRTRGVDIQITSTNLRGPLQWTTTVLISTLHDKVTKYDVAQTATSIQNSAVALLGKPLYGIYSYRWAGLDPATGDPQGYLGKQVSKNYQGIINNYSPDSLLFNGSARPTTYGNILNTFQYKGISLSFNVGLKLGYYFRNTSTSLNYSDILSNGGNKDFTKRWQKPGDELHTNVPSLVYPLNTYRNTFYQYSQVLVQNASFVRLQDISLGYDLKSSVLKKSGFEHLTVFAYANNIGLLWRANSVGVDPDAGSSGIPLPRTLAIGIKSNF